MTCILFWPSCPQDRRAFHRLTNHNAWQLGRKKARHTLATWPGQKFETKYAQNICRTRQAQTKSKRLKAEVETHLDRLRRLQYAESRPHVSVLLTAPRRGILGWRPGQPRTFAGRGR